MRISQLEGRRVALWGWGREGRAAYRALRARLPGQALGLFCGEDERADAEALGDRLLSVATAADADALAAFDYVIKSPGISPYRAEAAAAAARGTRFIGSTALWFAEHADDRILCVTGTKGKSTTTALLAHLLRAGGHRTALCGNIGLPLLELLEPDTAPEYWAVELSSYQTRDVFASGARPLLAIGTNLFPEHLDWHGSLQRYADDKLSLFTAAAPHIAVLNAADPVLAALQLPESQVVYYGREDGWHLRGDVVHRAGRAVFDTERLPLPGRHNRGNLCAVLAALEAIGLDAVALAPAARRFRPLPHRLQLLGTQDGLRWVNDSISTTPHATLAALECFRGSPVALLLGGHDRGLDWRGFAEALQTGDAPVAAITLGQNGPKIHALLEPVARARGFALQAAADLPEAVALARAELAAVADTNAEGSGSEGGAASSGVVLLSPGAPSFGAYRDYTERGRHFAALAGFDPEAIAAIPGLGIA